VVAQIAKGLERVGFQHYEGGVYLLSPASVLLEEQRSVLRRDFAELGAAWRAEYGPGTGHRRLPKCLSQVLGWGLSIPEALDHLVAGHASSTARAAGNAYAAAMQVRDGRP
jgi:hypothetical protein